MPLARHGLEWVQPEARVRRTRCPTAGPIVLYRDLDRDGRLARRAARGRRRRVGAVRRAVRRRTSTRVRDDDAVRLPAARRPAEAAAAPEPAGDCSSFTRLLPGSAVGLGKRLFDVRRRARVALRRGRCTATRRPTAPGSAIAAFYLNLLGHAVGWPSPRGGAERLTDALVVLPAQRSAATVRTGAPRRADRRRATAA